VSDDDLLAETFEQQRPRLKAVAHRMLGSEHEAEDAVQEAWLRLSRSGAEDVTNLAGWLTTVVSRICLDMLRSRTARREDVMGMVGVTGVTGVVGTDVGLDTGADAVGGEDSGHPEHQAVLADSVSAALLVVLETLAPAERLAFVLHDLFAVPFEQVGRILGRTPSATRQLASRARRRVQGRGAEVETERAAHREVVEAFLAASRGGDLDRLLRLLAPNAVVRADPAAVETGAEAEVVGAAAVAGTFVGRARAARAAVVDGVAGALWSVGGRPRVAFGFTVVDGVVVEIELMAEPATLERLGAGAS
jgi:RNA polymerase sigma-70 factor, ECF subfamily